MRVRTSCARAFMRRRVGHGSAGTLSLRGARDPEFGDAIGREPFGHERIGGENRVEFVAVDARGENHAAFARHLRPRRDEDAALEQRLQIARWRSSASSMRSSDAWYWMSMTYG
jgi:hypothetical protein